MSDAGTKILEPYQATTREQRVHYLAGLIAEGEYGGFPDRRRLTQVWDLKGPEFDALYDDAALEVTLGIGAMGQRQQMALGRWNRIYKRAMEEGDEEGPNLKAAALAQAGWDRAAQVVAPAAQTQTVVLTRLPEVVPVLQFVAGWIRRRFGEDAVAELRMELAAWQRNHKVDVKRLPGGR